MTSIFQKALGQDFHRLHPEVQRRFGFSSEDNIAQVGTGVMERVWRGRFYTIPFLKLGTWRNIMFPEHGHDLPFTVTTMRMSMPLGEKPSRGFACFRCQDTSVASTRP